MSATESGLALFPASFDPLTNGHLDLVHRASRVFPRLVVAIAHNVNKRGAFTVEERMDMLQTVLGGMSGVELTSFEGLVVDFASRIGATTIIRGLRANADFEYEFEMALMNRHMRPEIETLFLMTSQQYFYVSSSRLKELVSFGSDVSEWVPPIVESYLRKRFGAGAPR
jgi:pantetheine-phosphate adenylyltransferase